MHISRSIILSGLALGALTLSAVLPAHAADFTFVVSNPNLTVAPGDSSSFDGTVTFTSTPDESTSLFEGPSVFAVGTLSSSFFDPEFASFFDSPGDTLGSTYTGAIYDFTLSPILPGSKSPKARTA